MITIDQLLESVDLDFEPRFVTKDEDGTIALMDGIQPTILDGCWISRGNDNHYEFDIFLKLAEFENKPWQECIYEVPRKTTGKIYKFDSSAIDILYDSNPENFKKFICGEIVCKLNEIIDAVNELKGAKND